MIGVLGAGVGGFQEANLSQSKGHAAVLTI